MVLIPNLHSVSPFTINTWRCEYWRLFPHQRNLRSAYNLYTTSHVTVKSQTFSENQRNWWPLFNYCISSSALPIALSVVWLLSKRFRTALWDVIDYLCRFAWFGKKINGIKIAARSEIFINYRKSLTAAPSWVRGESHLNFVKSSMTRIKVFSLNHSLSPGRWPSFSYSILQMPRRHHISEVYKWDRRVGGGRQSGTFHSPVSKSKGRTCIFLACAPKCRRAVRMTVSMVSISPLPLGIW